MPAPPDARRNGVPERPRRAGAFKNPRGETVSPRMRRHDARSPLLAGRSVLRTVRRELQLARAGLDADELSAHRVAAKVPSLLRRRFQSRVPDWLGKIHDPERGGRRIVAAP